MTVSRQQILTSLLPGLEKLFGMEYDRYQRREEYVKRSKYGKYSIYKHTYEYGKKTSSETLAKGLSKAEAEGMMKLLKDAE